MSSITNLISVGVNGTGTANSVMKWLDADTATDSIITDNGSTISIGGSLAVSSAATISGGVTANALSLLNSGGTYANWFVNTFLIGRIGNVDSNDMYYDSTFGGSHYFRTGTGGTTSPTERMRIDSSGNVGIGISSPLSKLHVLGQSGTTGLPSVLLYGEPASTGQRYGFNVSVDALDISALGGSASIKFFTGGNASSITERLRIDSSGNVGIGTSPVGKLTVSNTSGGTTPSNYIQVLGSTADNSNYPAIELKGGTLADSFPSLSLTNGGLSTVISAGYHSTNYNNRASMTLQGGDGSVIISTGTSGTSSERMRITSGGYLKASNTGSYGSFSASTSYEFHSSTSNYHTLGVLNSSGSPYGQQIVFNGASPNNTTNFFIFASDSTESKFIVYSNGNVVNRNNSYGAISDAKLKENVKDASPKLDDLLQVKVRNFNYIGDDKKQLGVVAQELEEVFPSMIDESPDYEDREVEVKDEEGNIVYKTEQVLVSEEVLDEEGNVIEEAVYETVTTDEPEMTTERVDLGTTTKSVKYSVFVPMLIKAMQEQQEIINDLKARIETLETK